MIYEPIALLVIFGVSFVASVSLNCLSADVKLLSYVFLSLFVGDSRTTIDREYVRYQRLVAKLPALIQHVQSLTEEVRLLAESINCFADIENLSGRALEQYREDEAGYLLAKASSDQQKLRLADSVVNLSQSLCALVKSFALCESTARHLEDLGICDALKCSVAQDKEDIVRITNVARDLLKTLSESGAARV